MSGRNSAVNHRSCGGGTPEPEFIAEWDIEVLGVFRGTNARACAGAVLKADGTHQLSSRIALGRGR